MTDTTNSPAPPPPHGLRFDPTINIPTLLTVIVMFSGSLVFGVGLYNGISTQTDKNTTDLRYVQRDVDGLRTNQKELDTRTTEALRSLQQQNREDFNTVRSILNQLLLTSGAARPGAAVDGRVWTK